MIRCRLQIPWLGSLLCLTSLSPFLAWGEVGRRVGFGCASGLDGSQLGPFGIMQGLDLGRMSDLIESPSLVFRKGMGGSYIEALLGWVAYHCEDFGWACDAESLVCYQQ